MTAVENYDKLAPSAARRRTSWVAVALASIMLGASLGALIWLARYQPLVPGPGFGAPGGAEVGGVNIGSEYQFSHTPGGTFEVWAHIENTGPLNVTILDVFDRPRYYWRLADVEVSVYTPDTAGNVGKEFRAFTPVTLQPGEYGQFRLIYEFADCRTQGTASGFDSVRVLFKAAWLEREAEVFLGYPIGVMNVGGDCGDAAFTER